MRQACTNCTLRIRIKSFVVLSKWPAIVQSFNFREQISPARDQGGERGCQVKLPNALAFVASLPTLSLALSQISASSNYVYWHFKYKNDAINVLKATQLSNEDWARQCSAICVIMLWKKHVLLFKVFKLWMPSVEVIMVKKAPSGFRTTPWFVPYTFSLFFRPPPARINCGSTFALLLNQALLLAFSQLFIKLHIQSLYFLGVKNCRE